MPLTDDQLRLLWKLLDGEISRLADEMKDAAGRRDMDHVYESALQVLELLDRYRSSDAQFEDALRLRRDEIP